MLVPLVVARAGICFAVGFLRGVAASGHMLPDTLHKLPQEERIAYAKVMAFMTRVDDELTVDEMAMFEQRLGTALLSPNQGNPFVQP